MKYKVEMSKKALRALEDLNERDRKRVYDRIQKLADDPRPPGCKHMSGGYAGHLRIKVGDFRVVYKVVDDRLLVIIVKLGDRKDVYR